MDKEEVCVVCLGPIPKYRKQTWCKTSPWPTCCVEHKAFATNRSYATPEELQALWASMVRKESAIQQFLYAGASCD